MYTIKFLNGPAREFESLRGADLGRADLRGADLRDADLRGADLRYADLHGADLGRAFLRDADLRGADLRDADLRYAILHGADLRGAVGLAQFCIVPEGSLVVYKKTRGGVISLLIPADARRVNAYGSRKCRAEYAIVLDAPDSGAKGRRDPSLVYIKGETVRPDAYDPDPRVECSRGIHFFITRQEAEDY